MTTDPAQPSPAQSSGPEATGQPGARGAFQVADTGQAPRCTCTPTTLAT
ncbi:MAG: hypothetical protein ACRDN0_32140 [Trebonia sp.]